MKRLQPFLTAAVLIMLPVSLAQAGDVASVVTATGVDVRTHIEGDDRLVIAIVPNMHVKLNGRLGIGLTALDDFGSWDKDLPTLLMIEGEYFDGAVLQTIDFASGEIETPTTLGITYGACLPESGICILEEARVTLAREADGTLGLTMDVVEP